MSYVYAILGALSFSLGGAIVLNIALGSVMIATLRGPIAAVYQICEILLRRNSKRFPQKIGKNQWIASISLAMNSFFFIVAIILGGVAKTYLLCNATHMYMVIFGLVLERKLPKASELILALAAMTGVWIFFIADPTPFGITGTLIGLVGGILLTAYLYFGEMVPNEDKAWTPIIANISILFIGIFLMMFSITFGGDWIPPRIIAPMVIHDWKSLAFLVMLGFTSGTALMLWEKARKTLSKTTMAFLPTLVAVWAPLWSVNLAGERAPSAIEIAGLVIVHATVMTAWVLIHRRQ